MLTDDDWRLILIKQKSVVGSVLDDHQIYKVNKVIILPLSDADPQEFDLDVSVLFFFKYIKWDQYSGAYNELFQLIVKAAWGKLCFLYKFLNKYHTKISQIWHGSENVWKKRMLYVFVLKIDSFMLIFFYAMSRFDLSPFRDLLSFVILHIPLVFALHN